MSKINFIEIMTQKSALELNAALAMEWSDRAPANQG
jgi:hypothetical protein